MDLPSGTVTFLFTDIEGSTRLWERAPEAMRASLRRHNELVRSAVERYGGIEFGNPGDSICAAFTRPSDGVSAALECQLGLEAEAWAEDAVIRVRMSLHMGECTPYGGNYYGRAPNRCARILAAARGGQVVLSHTVAGLARDELPSDASLRDVGERRLRDLLEPERLFILQHPALPDRGLPLHDLSAVPNNLPRQANPLIGRDTDLVRVEELLHEVRCVTLRGPGGAGKTRMSVQIGADLLDNYPDGVWFVDLASISDPELIPDAILEATDADTMGVGARKGILEAFRSARALIILDNCEHLIEACAQVAESLLTHCAGVSILATTRETLRVEGEHVWRVPPLEVPETAEDILPEDAVTYPAIRLFVSRATAADASFRLTDDNVSTVIELCSRLDGIPLALELAAARLGTMSVADVARRLDQRFRLLTRGSRTRLGRQQTLEALVDWSYNLLGPEQQAFFTRLSVFAGSFSLEAVEQVCFDDEADNWRALDMLLDLADKSVVMQEEWHGETWYRLLETLRDYGAQRLTERSCVRRHREWYLALAERARPELTGAGYVKWQRRLDVDLENFRAALSSALEDGDVETAANIADALLGFWINRGHFGEARRWTARILKELGDDASEIRARTLGMAGCLAWFQGDSEEAVTMAQASLALANAQGDDYTRARAMQTLGLERQGRGEFEEAETLLRAAIALAEGHTHFRCLCLDALANAALKQGLLEESEVLYQEGLVLAREISTPRLTAYALFGLGAVARNRDDIAGATDFYRQSLQLAREIREPRLEGLNLAALGEADAAVGRHREALQSLVPALRHQTRVGDPTGVLFFLNLIGWSLHQLGWHREAAIVLGAWDAACVKFGAVPPEAGPRSREEVEASLGTQLDAGALQSAIGEGRCMTLSEAVAAANHFIEEAAPPEAGC